MNTNRFISISNARVHNLKNLDVDIPRGSFTVITGPSGSGKSSLAFDTLYAEGQRRYIECLSSGHRQFLENFKAPEVDSIEGLSPTLAVDQRFLPRNSRSTVGTLTEIADYLRVLFARVGKIHCPQCQRAIHPQTPQQMVRALLEWPPSTKLEILSPLEGGSTGLTKEEISKFLTLGFSKIRIDGQVHFLDDAGLLLTKGTGNCEIVIDRVLVRPEIEKRLNESVEYALKLGLGRMVVLVNQQEEIHFTQNVYCSHCHLHFPKVEERLFSFNSPLGACSQCQGLGEIRDLQPLHHLIPHPRLPLLNGALKTPFPGQQTFFPMIASMALAEGVDLLRSAENLPQDFLNLVLYGSEKKYTFSLPGSSISHQVTRPFPGIRAWLQKKFEATSSSRVRGVLEEFFHLQDCPQCRGLRLNPFALHITLKGKNLMEWGKVPLNGLSSLIKDLSFQGEEKEITKNLLKEIQIRIKFLCDIGLGYLHLNRQTKTLSGGEGQRIRLATQLGPRLSGVIYVLDEPSMGLHPKDNEQLIGSILSLKNRGNTVVVVEHDPETILQADYVIDMGPGAGKQGGEIVARGTPAQIMKNPHSLTGQYLSGKKSIHPPSSPREKSPATSLFLHLKGARQNNIHDLNVTIPLNQLVCLTGVSGSGKSTLIHQILVPALRFSLHGRGESKGKNYETLEGASSLTDVVEVDQSPIGKTSHSHPASYCQFFDDIRTLLSQTRESKIRAYGPARFSLKIPGGRCEACEGQGTKTIRLQLLPDVQVTCSECQGQRFNRETLSILYKGKNIHEILEMSVEEAHGFFSNHEKIKRILQTMKDIGLGYLKLGQPAPTLSGGEAQRLKIGRELSKKTQGPTLYVLDEPTTGLHFSDIHLLLKSLRQLIGQNHSVIVIEHQLSVVQGADHLIDLGPEGGEQGGKIMGEGTPRELAKIKNSHTGRFLKEIFNKKGPQ